MLMELEQRRSGDADGRWAVGAGEEDWYRAGDEGERGVFAASWMVRERRLFW